MAYDLGDVAVLSIKVTDVNGAAANAGAMVATVTAPDATTSTPSITNTPTGTYTVNFATTVAGRHVIRWVATGANAGSYTTVFNVDDPTDVGAISLDDVKQFLNIPASKTTSDDQLRAFIAAASKMWTNRVGPIAAGVTYDERYNGGSPTISLRKRPVIAVAAVVESWGSTFSRTLISNQPDSGSVGSAFDYSVDLATGLLVRRAMGVAVAFVPGIQNVHVTYTAGYTIVPEDIQQALLLLVGHMWETQRGRMVVPGQPADDGWNPAMGFTWPRRVLEIAQSYYIPGIG